MTNHEHERWAMEALASATLALDGLRTDTAAVERIAHVAGVMAERVRSGNKLMICGNGGSSADAMHFAEELTGRFRADRPAIAAIACTDAGHITCTANDYGYEAVFSRWVEALGRAGDVLIVLSTSGNSPNIVRAVEAGKVKGMTRVALLGRGGGALRGVCDHEWVVPGEQADRVQELHMVILHVLIEGIERGLGYAR